MQDEEIIAWKRAKQCAHCGGQFAPRARNHKYCDACRSSDSGRNLRPKATCVYCGAAYRTKKLDGRDRACYECQPQYLRDFNAIRYSSVRAIRSERAIYRKWSKRAANAERQRIERAAKLLACVHMAYPITCAECGGDGVSHIEWARFCSAQCRRRNQKRRSRLKYKAALKSQMVEVVDPISVLDRDDWTCQQCGVNTPRSKRGCYDDDAPELDHIIPLSRGGDHSYANTQCLCRRCNADKSSSVSA